MSLIYCFPSFKTIPVLIEIQVCVSIAWILFSFFFFKLPTSLPGCGYMLMCGPLSPRIVPTAVCPGRFLACEAEVQRSNPMSPCSEPVSFLRWPGYSWDGWAERVLIACLWPKKDRSGFSPEWNDEFGCDCNDGLVHLKMETSLLFPGYTIVKPSLQLWVGRKLREIIKMKCVIAG